MEFEDIQSHFKPTYEFIDKALSNSGKVLVHCSAGISRSTSIICAYLIKKNKITFEQAMKIIWEGRIIAEPNRSFAKQLKDWYASEVISSK